MKFFLIFLVLSFSSQIFADGELRSLDDRCDAHSKYAMDLLSNRYKGETLIQQLEMIEEWDDLEYQEEIKRILTNLIYTIPKEYTNNDIKYQALTTYTASYRSCIKKHA